MTLRPFKAREGFDASGHRGEQFADPRKLSDPLGDQDVVNRRYFWDHANFIRWDGRAGFLPDPLTTEIIAGEQYAVRMDFGGKFLGRIAVWDDNLSGPAKSDIPAGSVFPVRDRATITDPAKWPEHALFLNATGAENAGDYLKNATGVTQTITATAHGLTGQTVENGGSIMYLGDSRLGTDGYAILGAADTKFDHIGAAAVGTTPGNWRFLNTLTWLKSLASDPDQSTDVKAGDVQYTLEQQAKELKVWDKGAWQKIYSEIDVRAWIAALSLFEGTVQEVAGAVPNVLELSGLPDLALNNQIDKIAHYWTWQGSPGYAIQPGDPSGVGRDLPGTLLNPGDWLQVSNRSGDVAAPDLRWSHVGGDLLAKSRGDNLYGLKPWAAGGWEIGSLVVHDGSIWRATGPATTADPAPGAVGAPWQKITLAAGVRWVSVDGDLPAKAPVGEIYFVLQSAQAGGTGALYYWDGGANAWQPLGGAGGDAMDLSSGIPIVNVGVPIGTIQMWLVDNPPPGWLMMHGQTFSAGEYPELAAVLGRTNLPYFRGAFLRGAGLNANGNWGDASRQPGSWQDDSTAPPDNAFTIGGGGHSHQYWSGWNSRNGIKGGDWHGGEIGWGATKNTTEGTGEHSHTIGGGDAETRPKNFAVHYIIKGKDIAQRVRI